MKLKYLLYLIHILSYTQLSFEQELNGNNGSSNFNEINNYMYENSIQTENEQYQQVNNKQQQTITDSITQDQIIKEYQYNDLPKEIINYLHGYENFSNTYSKEIEEESKQNFGNLQCMKALLSNIHFPLVYNNSDHYYKTVCNPNTDIDALKYLNEIVDKKGDVCSDNGNNYQTAYKIIRVRHYQNCLKDIENSGRYCYEANEELFRKDLEYKITNYRLSKLKGGEKNEKNMYNSSICNMCNKNNTISYCAQAAIISNKIANILLKDKISLEIYYYGSNTYKLDMSSTESESDFDSSSCKCNINKIVDDLRETLKTTNDNSLKKLLNIYDESKSAGLSFYKNKLNILTLITVMLSIFHMLI
ncbi:hypothetical protein BCR36DRAFT_407779 [Piromyces finnis]|uniref:Uncharacterized protein n=1 Tax=Piromyces finnis TaxID=1754191 RepID=A0A1Y1VNP7_9FUNG|nr:hypothetical protein BCR36DRAFT_407779 [Piromyces finnis]|eukprot:ORX60773.1 hypothetical protein BCR36DRAFT_407779 [Piromyces finnis]